MHATMLAPYLRLPRSQPDKQAREAKVWIRCSHTASCVWGRCRIFLPGVCVRMHDEQVIWGPTHSTKNLKLGPSTFLLEHADSLGTCGQLGNTQTPRGQADSLTN